SAKGDDKFITTDYLQQCPMIWVTHTARIPSGAAVSTGWPASAAILTCSNRARAGWYWKAKPLSDVTLKKFRLHQMKRLLQKRTLKN
ncbi:MAG: hypothetical protein LBF18_21680, partial [Pantoea sp.]